VICIIGAGDQKTQLLSEMEKLREKSAAHEVFVLIQEPGMWVNCATGEQAAELPLQRPAVVSGIARPERFERFVTASGKKVVRTVRFPDHHPFSASEIRAAVSAPADGLATTEKDALRLRTVELADLSHIWYLRLRLVFVQPYAEERFCRMVMEGTLC